MPFVKLDCGILDSTLWVQPSQREVFITALLMAVPHELIEPEQQIEVRTLNTTEFIVPPGWYGFVPAAGVGIIRRAQVDEKAGMDALEALGSPDAESRSPEHDGRRMVRIDGGYLILNFQKYRDRDYTGAERSKRYRDRKASLRDVTSSHRDITQVEVEVEVEAIKPLCASDDALLHHFDDFWKAYPKKKNKGDAEKAWKKLKPSPPLVILLLRGVEKAINSDGWQKENGQFIPYPASWLNSKGWEDEYPDQKQSSSMFEGAM